MNDLLIISQYSSTWSSLHRQCTFMHLCFPSHMNCFFGRSFPPFLCHKIRCQLLQEVLGRFTRSCGDLYLAQHPTPYMEISHKSNSLMTGLFAINILTGPINLLKGSSQPLSVHHLDATEMIL